MPSRGYSSGSLASVPRAQVILLTAALVLQLTTLACLGDRHPHALFGDEISYWALSQSDLGDVLRPPGYPLLIAAVRSLLGDSPIWIFGFQSVALSLRPVLVFVLLLRAGVSRPWSFVAALLSAFSFTFLSLPKRVLADSLSGLLVPGAVLCLVTPQERYRLSRWGASVLAALGVATKPVLQVWFLVAPISAAILGGRGKKLARQSAELLACPAAMIALVIAINGVFVGQYRYSRIGELAVIRYWVPATLCLVETGGRWSDTRIDEIRVDWTPHDLRSGVPAERLFGEMKRRAWATLRAHPVQAVEALTISTWRNLPRPFFPYELGVLYSPRTIAPAQWAVGKSLTYILWLAAGLGAVKLLLSAETRRVALVVGACSLALVVATSVSHAEGGRLLFPMEWSYFFFLGGLGRRSNVLKSTSHHRTASGN